MGPGDLRIVARSIALAGLLIALGIFFGLRRFGGLRDPAGNFTPGPNLLATG